MYVAFNPLRRRRPSVSLHPILVLASSHPLADLDWLSADEAAKRLAAEEPAAVSASAEPAPAKPSIALAGEAIS